MADFAELQAQLKTLSDAYAAHLPEKFIQIEQAWGQLSRGEWDEEGFQALHRMVHNLSGSGKTFGFTSLSEVARNLEECLSGLAQSKTAPNEEQYQRIREKLNELFQVDIRREDIRRLGGED